VPFLRGGVGPLRQPALCFGVWSITNEALTKRRGSTQDLKSRNWLRPVPFVSLFSLIGIVAWPWGILQRVGAIRQEDLVWQWGLLRDYDSADESKHRREVVTCEPGHRETFRHRGIDCSHQTLESATPEKRKKEKKKEN